jgi:ABC-type Mn2+/Zn2+ transport system ATPase subunit
MSVDAAAALDASQTSVIVGRGLTFGYPRRELFENVSFAIAGGAILGIVGPNGCGKTTLLRTILGLLPPRRGAVTWAKGLTVSYVPQRERLDVILPLTALDVVLMGRAARAGPLARLGQADREAADRALARLDARTLAHRAYRNLSGGEQQRVLLARALVGDPDVLVLDEPTAGMDLGSEAAIVEFLRDLNRGQGVTILLVTHLLPLVLSLATSIMLFARGTILQGALDDVLQEKRLTALYGVPVHLGAVAGRPTLVVGAQKAE